MQTTKQAAGLRTAAKDYQTIVQQAISKVSGFGQLYKDLERAISVSGKSTSTLTNYGRHLAHLALHTYATHLLEQGVNILTIKDLPGHASIDTTMIYLHLARPSVQAAFSPMDTLYNHCK